MSAIAVGLDLGTTRIKAAELRQDGTLSDEHALGSPTISGEDPIRESRAENYLESANKLLEKLPKALPLGISSQRSSFLLWDKNHGQALTPLISWQDRRAHKWCQTHESDAASLVARTGLLLSPHYVGPKLAYLFDSNAALRNAAASGKLLFGTLETFLIWHWTGGAVHETDLSMAARTLLVDPAKREWDNELLAFFHVPAQILPNICSTNGRAVSLDNGFELSARIADQPAAVVALLNSQSNEALVNIGTGAFVLRLTGERFQPAPGFLAGPVLSSSAATQYALEGTINGGGKTADSVAPGPTELPISDPTPEAFCLPDESGVGAPHWRPTVKLSFSEQTAPLDTDSKRRVVLEGIVFRVREILEGIFADDAPSAVLLSGGLSHEPFVAHALANCLDIPVTILFESEAGLLGASRLAAGLGPYMSPAVERVVSPDPSSYLFEKYLRWKTWVGSVLT